MPLNFKECLNYMGKYSRLGKNTIIVFVGNFGAKLIGFLMLPLYTRWLSVSDYGLTDILNTYVSLLTYIVSCCISDSIFIFPKDESEENKREYFSSGFLFAIFMMVLTAIIFYTLSLAFPNVNNSFFNNIWFIYWMVIVAILQQLTQQFTRSIDKMFVYGSTGIVNTVFLALFSILLIPAYSVKGYIYAMILSSAVAAVYSLFFSKGYKYLSIKSIDTTKLKEMLKYSIPLIPNGIMWWLVSALNRPIMEANSGLHDIGILAVAQKFPSILIMVFTVFSTSWQISVIEEYKKEGFLSFFNNIFRVITALNFVVFIIISLLSEVFVKVFTTEEYYEAWKYIPLLTLGAVISSFSTLLGSVFSAIRKSKSILYSSIWGGVTAIAFNLLLIPKMGILGAVLAVVISYVAMVLSRLYYSSKYVTLVEKGKYMFMVIVGIILSLSAVFCSRTIFIIISCVSILVLYVINRDLKDNVKSYVLSIRHKNNEF